MKIVPTLHLAIAADHRGFVLKQKLIEQQLFGDYMIVWHDCGASDSERSDYPLFAKKLCEQILAGSGLDRGILLCGTGTGMAMAANRFKNIYAAVAWSEEIARRAREEDWSNVLVLPADYLDLGQSAKIITAWLHAEPKAGRYHARVAMLD